MRKFKELQTELFNMEITRTDLAKMMGRSVTYLTDRFSRKKPFTLDDVYFLCDTLGIGYAEIPKYFPQKD